MNNAKKYLPPPFMLSKVINPIIIKLGLLSVLNVKGRKSGKEFKIPVTPLEYKGEIFLVAPRGETQWARNLWVHPIGSLTTKGKTRNFTATVITGNTQTEVVKLYQQKVPAVKAQFDSLPDPKDHPVFKLKFKE